MAEKPLLPDELAAVWFLLDARQREVERREAAVGILGERRVSLVERGDLDAQPNLLAALWVKLDVRFLDVERREAAVAEREAAMAAARGE
jgi:hypothetical protein